jgi:hypothetical protein
MGEKPEGGLSLDRIIGCASWRRLMTGLEPVVLFCVALALRSLLD